MLKVTTRILSLTLGVFLSVMLLASPASAMVCNSDDPSTRPTNADGQNMAPYTFLYSAPGETTFFAVSWVQSEGTVGGQLVNVHEVSDGGVGGSDIWSATLPRAAHDGQLSLVADAYSDTELVGGGQCWVDIQRALSSPSLLFKKKKGTARFAVTHRRSLTDRLTIQYQCRKQGKKPWRTVRNWNKTVTRGAGRQSVPKKLKGLKQVGTFCRNHGYATRSVLVSGSAYAGSFWQGTWKRRFKA